jgi:hypothetical protein
MELPLFVSLNASCVPDIQNIMPKILHACYYFIDRSIYIFDVYAQALLYIYATQIRSHTYSCICM